MYINTFGQPLLPTKYSKVTKRTWRQFFEAPEGILILVTKKQMQNLVIPENWNGKIYVSIEVWRLMQRKNNFMKYDIAIIRPHIPTRFTFAQGIVPDGEITLIPLMVGGNWRGSLNDTAQDFIIHIQTPMCYSNFYVFTQEQEFDYSLRKQNTALRNLIYNKFLYDRIRQGIDQLYISYVPFESKVAARPLVQLKNSSSVPLNLLRGIIQIVQARKVHDLYNGELLKVLGVNLIENELADPNDLQ